MSSLNHLFSPIQIGNMTSPNRLLMSAMSINFGVDEDGFVNEQLTEYFVARAKGGVGMMLVGGGAVHPTGLELPNLPKLWNDNCIPSLKKMVAAVKPYDTRFGVQLMHGGRQSYHDSKVAPSPIPAPAVVKGIPKELTIPEIQELVQAFGDSARRCREAGFEFIEIHGAHGYLINQFLSLNSNKRTDEYGCASFENRSRFLMELFRDIRKKCGADFPVGIRMNGQDYIKDGLTLDDALHLAPILEKEGAAYLHVSAGVYGSTQLTIPSMYVEHGCFVHLAEAVKKKVSIPVVTVGRIKDPRMADQIIADGKADVVALGRSVIADPDYPNKAKSGAFADIRPCMGCCLGCIHAVLALEPGSCVVNPEVGREYQLKNEKKPERIRKVLVVGAGPSGMAAARILAMRGHQVTICEKQDKFGGVLRLAAKAPGRGEVGDVLKFLERELEKYKVPVLFSTELNAELLDELRPEIVILATGSLPEMPIIKGLFQTKMELMTVTDVMAGEAEAGEKVIVLGGGQAGMVLADFLAEKGKEVALLNRKPHFGEEMSANDRFYLRERLKRDSVKLYKKVSVQAFSADGVTFRSDNTPVTLQGFDTVVLSEKMNSVRDAMQILKGRDAEVHLIGDAKTPRSLMFCMSEAEEIARSL